MQAWTPAFHLSGSVIHVGSGLGHPPPPSPIIPHEARQVKQGQPCQELDSAAPGTSGRKAGAWGSPTRPVGRFPSCAWADRAI